MRLLSLHKQNILYEMTNRSIIFTNEIGVKRWSTSIDLEYTPSVSARTDFQKFGLLSIFVGLLSRSETDTVQTSQQSTHTAYTEQNLTVRKKNCLAEGSELRLSASSA